MRLTRASLHYLVGKLPPSWKVHVIPQRKDNYSYILQDEANQTTMVIDPSDDVNHSSQDLQDLGHVTTVSVSSSSLSTRITPIRQYIESSRSASSSPSSTALSSILDYLSDKEGCECLAVLLTHKHYDHILGLPGLLLRDSKGNPSLDRISISLSPLPVYCPEIEKVDIIKQLKNYCSKHKLPLDWHSPHEGQSSSTSPVVFKGLKSENLLDLRSIKNTSSSRREGASSSLVHYQEEEFLSRHNIQVLNASCHTLGHVMYYLPPTSSTTTSILFTGDALFTGGMGRFFEGDARDAIRVVELLRCLPPSTLVFCGHNYALSNLHFALSLSPGNKEAISRKIHQVEELMRRGECVLSTLEEEFTYNPFLRYDAPDIIEAMGSDMRDPERVMAKLREIEILDEEFLF